jgi:hypothetical protein
LEKAMRINYERSGGIAGMRLTTTVDTGAMPTAQANELNGLVASSGFFSLPASIPSTGGADQFTYTVTIEDQGRQHTVVVKDGGVPPGLQPLLQRLAVLARQR